MCICNKFVYSRCQALVNFLFFALQRKPRPMELLPHVSKIKPSRDQWSYKQPATKTAEVPSTNLPQSNTKSIEKPFHTLPMKQKTTFQSEESHMSLQVRCFVKLTSYSSIKNCNCINPNYKNWCVQCRQAEGASLTLCISQP